MQLLSASSLIRILPFLFFLLLHRPAAGQTVRHFYMGGGLAYGVGKEPFSAGLTATGGGYSIAGGYAGNLGSRWFISADALYHSLNLEMKDFGDLSFYDKKASQEIRFGLSYQDLHTRSILAKASAGYLLAGHERSWRPWLGLGLEVQLANQIYLHPVTNTRVYVRHFRPSLVSTIGLNGTSDKWVFTFRADAVPAAVLTKSIRTNSQKEKAAGPDLIGPALGGFDLAVYRQASEDLLIGFYSSGLYRYAGEKNGGFAALTAGLRLGFQIGT